MNTDTLNAEQSSYRQIFKATSIFGGVQVFQIIVGVARVKVIAVLLGATGVGIISLFNAPLQLLISLTGLGVALGAVRDISVAHGSGDKNRIASAITTLRRWSWFTGLLGASVTITFAPLLSRWTFGTSNYTWAFIWLSVILVLQSLSKCQSTILQGTRRLRDMAKAGVIGSALGLASSIPLFYYFGIDGVVPAMILAASSSLGVLYYYVRKAEFANVKVSINESYKSGLEMVKLGISMTLAGFIATLSTYVLNAFISNNGGIEQVGLYNAGWNVVGQYTGIVFTAMATDYFPRISSIQNDNAKVIELVTHQSTAALLIMTPLLSLIIITMPFVIKILYTPAFLPVVMFANLTVLGMQFKALAWAMGYVFLAKRDGKTFLILEIISGTIVLVMNLLFYQFYGLNGLGISFILTYILGVVLYLFVLKKKYQISFPGKLYRMLLVTNGIVIMSFLTGFIKLGSCQYFAGIIVFILAALFSWVKLNKLMDLKSYFSRTFRN